MNNQIVSPFYFCCYKQCCNKTDLCTTIFTPFRIDSQKQDQGKIHCMFFLFKNVAKEIIAVLILTKEHIEKLILSHTQQQTYSFISYIEVPFNTSPIFQSCFFLGSMVTPLKIVLSGKLGDGRQAWQGRSYSHSFCFSST